VWQNDDEDFVWVRNLELDRSQTKIYSFEELKEYVENVVA